jgi:hypothetical protein
MSKDLESMFSPEAEYWGRVQVAIIASNTQPIQRWIANGVSQN